MEEAMAPDNKWNLHIDYRTRLKTFELLLKLQNEKFGQNNIHLNFFASPKKLRH
jgi:hypothetical protein